MSIDIDYFKEVYHDKEMYEHFMLQVLKPGDDLYDKEGSLLGQFSAFGTKYIGRLDNPGVNPGRYKDRSVIITTSSLDEGLPQSCTHTTTYDVFLGAVTYDERYAALPDGWQFIDYSEDFLEDIPVTPFIEGDIVRLTDDQHENYSEDLSKNQFTVYRVDYESVVSESDTRYRVRAGELLFYATESQLKAAAHGLSPIRILEQGQQLRFRTLKDEAEFYILIGNYKRVFNPTSFSYKWDLATAQQMIALTKAHGILKRNDSYYLINFSDDEIGRQVAAAGVVMEA